MKKKVVFRVDGGKKIGLGHVTRCLALADILRKDFQIQFFCQPIDEDVLTMIKGDKFEVIMLPLKNDWIKEAELFKSYIDDACIVILDGYIFREEYQRIIKTRCYKLVCIDDINDYYFYADIVINHSEHAKFIKYQTELHTKKLFGGDYALLRKPFYENCDFKRTYDSTVKKLLISMGGADPENQTLKVLKSIELLNENLTVNVVIGLANPYYKNISQWINTSRKKNIFLYSNLQASEMCDQIIQNDLIITTGSTTAWEACCIGIPMIVGVIADNQIQIASVLARMKAAVNIGFYKTATLEGLSNAYRKILKNKQFCYELVENQKKIVDGKAKKRYQKAFREIAYDSN